MSPWADLSNSGPSHLYNATKDPSFGVEPDQWDGSTPVGVDTTYPDGLNAKTPYLSPSFGDYAGFPPMLLQAGDLEVLLSDSQMVYDNAIAHGVDCTLTYIRACSTCSRDRWTCCRKAGLHGRRSERFLRG